MNYSQIKQAAHGQWRGILSALAGLTDKELSNKHQPCPACGGHDRYRYDDKDGEGSYFCNGCGAGDGIDLLCKVTGMDFTTAANAIADYLNFADIDIDQPIRKKPPAPTTTRKHNFIDQKAAEAWIIKAEPIPFTEYTINRLISPKHLIGSGNAAVEPIFLSKQLVNCAAIMNDGSIKYAADHFTYGGYSIVGAREGKSYFICHNWVDAWIIHNATNCLVFCCWSPNNFEDAARQIKKDYPNKPIYLALNKEKNELFCAEETGLKCIVPSGQSGYFDQDRAIENKLYTVGEIINALEHNSDV